MGSPVDEPFFARLAQLQAQFADALPDTLARLARACARLDPCAPDAAALDEAQALLYVLAGSAPTFGLRELGGQARALEQRLRVLTAFETVGAADWRAWTADVDAFVLWAGSLRRV